MIVREVKEVKRRANTERINFFTMQESTHYKKLIVPMINELS